MNTRLQQGLAWVLVPLFFSAALSACQRAGEDSGAASSGASGGTSQSGAGESSAGGGMGDSDASGGSDTSSEKLRSPKGD